jgi:hypothetical protein
VPEDIVGPVIVAVAPVAFMDEISSVGPDTSVVKTSAVEATDSPPALIALAVYVYCVIDDNPVIV